MKRLAVVVVAGMAIAGAVIGVLWFALAPPVHGAVALTKSGKRVHVYLGNEADHFFISAVIMAGLLAGVAVVAAVLVWQWRAHRGPRMVIALTLGGLAEAGAATGVGAALGRLYYGAVDVAGAPISQNHRVWYVTEAASVFFAQTPLQALATLLAPVAAATMSYAVLATASARDDLGVEPSVPETAG
jgi:Protein of unknown function (DUF2567)